MIFRRILLMLFASAAFVAPVGAASKKAEAPDYKGAIVVDVSTGTTLFESNPDYVGPPASVTKLMTFLVVSDRIRAGHLTLETPVTVVAADTRMGGTQVWLKEHEVFTVDELLYALMVQSANDAAHALARAAAGTREAFVELMNERAKELGMTNTTFRTPHGLPPPGRKLQDSDVTSPRDLAKLALELVTKTDVLRYSSTNKRPFREGATAQVNMDNHNNLLGKVSGVDGLKTGFTNAAGFCLAATAERKGRRLVVVVMGSPRAAVRDRRVVELLERGFANLPAAPAGYVAPSNSPIASPVAPSASSPIAAPAAQAPAAKQEPAPTVTFPTPKKR